MTGKSLPSGRRPSSTKASSARYEFKESPVVPVVFRSKKYPSASDALSSYINDFEGHERKYNTTKYDEELMNLFCPQYQPIARAGKPSQGPFRRGKSKREQELEKLVQQAYDQLKRLKDSKKVEDSLNASTRLMETLDRDRLPSPTRSAILLPYGRPSTESISTDVLLEAKPLDFSAPYSQPVQNHTNHSFLESLDLKSSAANNSFSTLKGPYQLTGMDELMGTFQRDPMASGKTYSTDSLTVNDLIGTHSSGVATTDCTRKSFTADSVSHKRDLLTTSHLGSIKNRPLTTAVDISLRNSLNGTLSDNARPHVLLDHNWGTSPTNMRTSNVSVLKGKAAAKTQEVDVLLDSSWNKRHHFEKPKEKDPRISTTQSERSSSTNYFVAANGNKAKHSQPKVKGVSSLRAYLTNGQTNGINGSYTDKSMTSLRTDQSSSIISGHLLKGKQQRGVSKVVSTPKRGDQHGDAARKRSASSKQLRFDLHRSNVAHRSKLGHSLDSKDLSAHSKSLDLSNIEMVSDEKPDFTYGRRDIVSILKPPSPGKLKKTASRVSFTTDDLIHADASGVGGIKRRPRSKSLPRPHTTFENMEYSAHESRQNSSSGDTANDLTGSSRARLQQSGLSMEDVKSIKYKQFLEGLMKDIEESSSSIVTTAISEANPVDTSYQHVPTSSNQEGPGFLARIKELLTSPPSVSQYLVDTTLNESLSTDLVLEGDRSWEQIVAFKPPKEIQIDEKKESTRFERFMEDCMAEAQGHEKTLTGKEQPGALETLKNMMFKMQSFSSDPQTQEPNDTVEEEPNLPLDDSIDQLLSPETRKLLSKSYAQQPGGPCLAKAMEHLTKLKELVDHKPGEER